MGRLDGSEKYYHRLLKRLPPDDADIAGRCCGLGNIATEKGNYDASLEWHQKSLAKRTILGSGHFHLTANYISIGCAYLNQADYKQALESYWKVYDIVEKAFGDNHPDVAMRLNNIGCVRTGRELYQEAHVYPQTVLRIR